MQGAREQDSVHRIVLDRQIVFHGPMEGERLEALHEGSLHCMM